MSDKTKQGKYFNNTLIIFLAVQLISVCFSTALSSLAFGIWGGLWIILLIVKRESLYTKEINTDLKYFYFFFGIFISSEIISRVFAVIPEGAFVNLKSFLLFLIFFAVISKFKTEKLIYQILFIVLIVFSIFSLYELGKYAYNLGPLLKTVNSADIRIDYLGYPLSMGECKMLLLMTVIPLFFAKDKLIIKKWLLALISAPIFISMFLTQSRNVMLATAICLVITGIFINKRFLVLLIIVFTAGWLALPGSMQDRIKSIANPQHESNKSRLIMWNIGWQMFVDHPITGVGDNEITEIYKLYKKP
ncbi:O-antigen ligase domain-containing protein, partial [bacterium]